MDEVSGERVYLRSGTKIEPLSYNWYVWGHLLPPLHEGINMVERQIPLLESFIAHAPDHVLAAADPDFLCAPIIHLDEVCVPAVSRILEETRDHGGPKMRLARDMVTAKQSLAAAAKGHSLDPHYQALPASIRGLVELSYGVDNTPKLRVIEELVYISEHGNGHGQQLSFFLGSEQERRFFLNTPRVDADDRLIAPVPFRDARVDLLARTRLEAVDFATLAAAFLPDGADASMLRAFFTTEAPERVEPLYTGTDVRVRYFGQACILLQTTDVSILVDPVVTWDRNADTATLTFDDLPDFIDYVFLTHAHVDHFCPEVLLQLRGRIGKILVPRNNDGSVADPSMRLMLRALGFDNVVVMDTFDQIRLPDGHLMSLPFLGEHADLDIASKHALHVVLRGRGVLFLADSDCADPELYRRLAAVVGKVDLAFIGMECHGAPLSWLYGQYLPARPTRQQDESRRLSGCNAERAWTIIQAFGCSRTFVYAMGQEPWLRHLSGLSYTPDSVQLIESEKFINRCRAAGVEAERLMGCRQFVI